ncbi:MAG: thymidylate synthase, partial [Betaproteobacteria bacterium]
QVQLQLSRTPLPYPQLNIKRCPPSLFDYAYEDFEILNYEHHPAIKAPVAV